ncbi:MAG: hypothetical protein U0V87_08195 [Acidobacteriota bacterium]
MGEALALHAIDALRRSDPEEIEAPALVVADARSGLGERTLVPLWQSLPAHTALGRRSHREQLASAAGLTADALTPLDTPARAASPDAPDALA